jgi:periplasmic divalent cation tolerance protein
MSDFIQVIVATDSEDGAHEIAEALVTRRLAASCWVSGPITSRYWWKGVVEKAHEWVCTAKTRADLYIKVEQVIKEIHPYEVPGILAIPVEAGSQAYFDWINHETVQSQQEQTGSSKEQLIQELIDAHEQLIAAASKAYERGVRRIEDTWGPREILAHVAGWEAMAISRIPRVVAGMPPIKYATEDQHAAMDDAINATVVTMIGDQPFDAVCNILRNTYQADAQIIRELEEAVVRPGTYVYERAKAAIEHCYEHIQALEQMHS